MIPNFTKICPAALQQTHSSLHTYTIHFVQFYFIQGIEAWYIKAEFSVILWQAITWIKTYPKTKIDTKKHNNRQNVNICIRNIHTNRGRKQFNIFERKVYRRILGPVYDNEKENWKILTN
jgi:hypothetical protein